MKKLIAVLTVFVVSFVLLTSEAFARNEVKEWTFLTFINGHNNLDYYGGLNVRQMEEVGSNDNVNVIVQRGSLREPTKRYYIQKSSDPTQITSPVVMEMPAVDFGDYKELINFVRWGAENYPAKHYFINVWNHGNGWKLFDGFGAIRPFDISYDDQTNNVITTEQLGLAMAEIKQILGKNVDIYGSDACLMAMAEVAGEMADSVDYFVGSEELEPADGWPYHRFLESWYASDDQSPRRVTQILTQEFLKAYSLGGSFMTADVTLSAMDLSHMPRFYEELTKLGEDLLKLPEEQFSQVELAAHRTQQFYYSDYRDLGDFLRRTAINTTVDGQELISLAGIRAVMKDMIVANDVSEYYKNSEGLAVWLPTIQYSYTENKDRYSGLNISKNSSWDEFLARVNN